jgi:CubicO group peptidase (beta-lactamase class C family)
MKRRAHLVRVTGRAAARLPWKLAVLALCTWFAPDFSLSSSDDPAAATLRSAFEAQYPKSDASGAALEIERLAAGLGIEMAPLETPNPPTDEKPRGEAGDYAPFTLKARKDRRRPSDELERSFQTAAVSEFLNRELLISEDRIGAPPPQLDRFLADNESGIAAIESLLLREPEIRWEMDVGKYPNGPLPNLTGFMRLQRLLAARALVKARGGETDAALRSLDAGWRLNEVLSSRPEVISQLIVAAAAKIHVGVLRKVDTPAYGWTDRLRSRRFYSAFLTAFQNEVWANPDVEDLTGEAGTYGRILQEVAGELSDRDICSWTPEKLRETWRRAIRDQSREEVPVASIAMPSLTESVDRWRRFLVDAELTALVLDARAERAASRRRAWPGRLNGIGAGVCPNELWTYSASEDGTATFAFEGRIGDTSAPLRLPLRFTAGAPSAPAPRPHPLDLYVDDLMRRAGVPGAAVVIVENGRTTYAKGFGVRELGKHEPVTPDTLMMIGSTGKSMTTMMMAALVDDGKISWDTPAARIDPDFAFSDPVLTPKVTLRQTVCNCSGLQRRDLEMFFAEKPSTAEEVVRSIRTFPLVGRFGKTFGYVNQLVGAGGYVAAWAVHRPGDDLQSNYFAQMQKRVFDPIGMTSTTFSFERARANPNRATPHGQNAAGEYLPISLDLEKPVTLIAPAGASWSTAADAARYLITQLNRGVAPSGKRVVSAENLEVTRQSHVEIQPGASYGLGWVISKYKERTLLSHGGGTAGFTADFSLLPDDRIGIAVLTNAQNAAAFTSAVRWRAIEIAFGQPMEMDSKARPRLEQAQQLVREKTARAATVTERAVAPRLGSYMNSALGRIELSFRGDELVFKAAAFTSELKLLGEETYVLWDPPLAGALVRFQDDGSGAPSFVFDADDPDIKEKYSFTEIPRSSSPP